MSLPFYSFSSGPFKEEREESGSSDRTKREKGRRMNGRVEERERKESLSILICHPHSFLSLSLSLFVSFFRSLSLLLVSFSLSFFRHTPHIEKESRRRERKCKSKREMQASSFFLPSFAAYWGLFLPFLLFFTVSFSS